MSHRRPDLFIIGAPKCGTTSVYEWLKGHPDVYMSPTKEPNFFSPALSRSGRARTEEQYLRLFAAARHEQRIGEATPHYLFTRDAPLAIRAFQPNAYIIAMLRNPVEMVYSLHGQRLAEGNEDQPDIEQALAAEAERKLGRHLPRGAVVPLKTIYRDWARFSEQLPQWFDVFGRDRVHVIILEDLKLDAAAEFRRLLEFLEVDRDYQPAAFATYNPTHGARSVLLRDLMRHRRPSRALRGLFPQPARDFIRHRIIAGLWRANKKPATRLPMSAELRRRLEREFAPEVARSSELLGRDLSKVWFDAAQPAAGEAT